MKIITLKPNTFNRLIKERTVEDNITMAYPDDENHPRFKLWKHDFKIMEDGSIPDRVVIEEKIPMRGNTSTSRNVTYAVEPYDDLMIGLRIIEEEIEGKKWTASRRTDEG